MVETVLTGGKFGEQYEKKQLEIINSMRNDHREEIKNEIKLKRKVELLESVIKE